ILAATSGIGGAVAIPAQLEFPFRSQKRSIVASIPVRVNVKKIIRIAPYGAGFQTSLNCLLPFLVLRADSATRFTSMPKESGKHADSRVAPKERQVEELQSGKRFGSLSHHAHLT